MEKPSMLSLAEDVLGDLLHVASAKAATTLLDGAVDELDRRVEWAWRLALGPLARGDFPDKPFDLAAGDLLQAARREMHDLFSSHAAIARAFAVARTQIGANNHPNLVDAYDARHQDAFLYSRLCLDRLLSTAGRAAAAADVFAVARGVPYASPEWRGWAVAAEGLSRAAHLDACAALDALHGMTREVCGEIFAAWAILHALKRDHWVAKARQVPVKLYGVANFVPNEPAAHASPSEKVAAAHDDLHRVLKIHARAGEDLISAATHLGLPRGDLWKRWSTRHSDVAVAGNDALASLKSAGRTLVDSAVALQGGSKLARDLVLTVRHQLRSARQELARTRNLSTLEFFDAAWITLKPLSSE